MNSKSEYAAESERWQDQWTLDGSGEWTRHSRGDEGKETPDEH